MRILLTNDDGFECDGLKALCDWAKTLGEVCIVAPDGPRSYCGHSVTSSRSISVEKHSDGFCDPFFVCDGTPADCVRIALHHLKIGPFDRVFSGINRGGNLGMDVWYSGTVAAAREAALHGVPAIAFSQLIRPTWSDNWSLSTRWAESAYQAITERYRTLPMLTNINLPDISNGGTLLGIRFCPLANTPLNIDFEITAAPNDDRTELLCRNPYFDRCVPPETDYDLLMRNFITITPLSTDQTLKKY